jgi:tRNA dimethylallyltransferase
MASDTKTVIVIAGPTASGKTTLAIEIAKFFETEIISFDSRQCYKELNIGVARPSRRELSEVRHHFIASHSIQETITAASFEQFAIGLTENIFRYHNQVVMVGGTGFYLKAFSEGMDILPDIPEWIRNEVTSQYSLLGLKWLQQEIQQLDPDFFKKGEIQNPRRMMRALEVYRATGRSILDFQKGVKKKRSFSVLKVAPDLPKHLLHERINARVDKMMEDGLLEEVRSLTPYRQLPALQTVGYKELFDHLDGMMPLPDAIHLIKRNTRQYAKRQLTWFRKDQDMNWFANPDDILPFIKNKLT